MKNLFSKESISGNNSLIAGRKRRKVHHLSKLISLRIWNLQHFYLLGKLRHFWKMESPGSRSFLCATPTPNSCCILNSWFSFRFILGHCIPSTKWIWILSTVLSCVDLTSMLTYITFKQINDHAFPPYPIPQIHFLLFFNPRFTQSCVATADASEVHEKCFLCQTPS